MPRHDEQYVPAPKRQIVPCTGCGAGLEVGWKRKLPARCTDCSAEALATACRQIAEKSGPAFEKHLRGLLDYLARAYGGTENLMSNLPDRLSST